LNKDINDEHVIHNFDILNPNIKSELFELYNINNIDKSNEETLNEFIKIDNISIDENIINGSFKYPRKAIKGKVMLDRNLGNIVYSHYNDEFRGDCSIFMKSTKKF
jgi:hypothetical protein